MPLVLGILALQGDYGQHSRQFGALGVATGEVRTPDDLRNVIGLVIPGGESTTMTKLLTPELRSAVMEFAEKRPVWGTCAGMIMLAQDTGDPRVKPLSLIDLEVDRNGFGRQVHSFEAELKVGEEIEDPERPLHGVFIRAPRVKDFAKSVKPLVFLDQEPVALRQGNCLVSSFHPELTTDLRLHRYFLKMAE